MCSASNGVGVGRCRRKKALQGNYVKPYIVRQQLWSRLMVGDDHSTDTAAVLFRHASDQQASVQV
jgi:hypothetical protein